MKASIKLLALSLGGVVVVGGGISAAAYFLIEKDTPTDVAYIFDGKTFKTSSQVKDYIFDKSTPKTVPTFNGTAYKDASGEYSLKSAWDAASKGFQLVQDGYATNALPGGADTTFVQGFDETNLMTNNVETKTAYAICKTPSNYTTFTTDKHAVNDQYYYMYATPEGDFGAKKAWLKLNPISEDPSHRYNTMADADAAFNSRSKNTFFKDNSFVEVTLAKNIYDAAFDEHNINRQIASQILPEATTYLEYHTANNIPSGTQEPTINSNTDERRVLITREGQTPSLTALFAPGWRYNDTARNYPITSSNGQYTKMFRVATPDGKIVSPDLFTTNEEFTHYRDSGYVIPDSFYKWDGVANKPTGMLPEKFPDLVKYVPTKDSGFDFTFSDPSLGSQNYKDLNEFYEKYVTTTGSK